MGWTAEAIDLLNKGRFPRSPSSLLFRPSLGPEAVHPYLRLRRLGHELVVARSPVLSKGPSPRTQDTSLCSNGSSPTSNSTEPADAGDNEKIFLLLPPHPWRNKFD